MSFQKNYRNKNDVESKVKQKNTFTSLYPLLSYNEVWHKHTYIMSFTVSKNVGNKTYFFNGEVRIHKKVMSIMAEKGAISELLSMIEDVRKRAEKNGLNNPIQFYSHEKLGIDLQIVDKMSKQELEDTSVETHIRNRNHYCTIKLVK